MSTAKTGSMRNSMNNRKDSSSNTKVVDIISALKAYSVAVDVYDPWVDLEEARHEYGLECLPAIPNAANYAAVVLAVNHQQFRALTHDQIKAMLEPDGVVFDVKGAWDAALCDGRL